MPSVRDIAGAVTNVALLPLRVTLGVVKAAREVVEQQVGGSDDDDRLYAARDEAPGPTAIRTPPLPTPEQRADPPEEHLPPLEPRPPAEAFREPTPPVAELVDQGHVSEEPVVVDERSDPGAEDGPGPEIHLDPELRPDNGS